MTTDQSSEIRISLFRNWLSTKKLIFGGTFIRLGALS